MKTIIEMPTANAARRNLPVLVLDEIPSQAETISDRLANCGFPVVGATRPEEAFQKICRGGFRVVLASFKMPEIDGFAFLNKALQYDPGLYVILATEHHSPDSAIEAIRRGAYDYVCKPLDFARLERALDELAATYSQRAEIRELEEKLSSNLQFHGIVGKSPAMLEMYDQMRRVACHYSNALITGPAGAGKELVARAIHWLSPVSHQRFAVCNCAALADARLESHLFGHVRGAFAGATETRGGLFEYAHGGTVLLDRIGETSLAVQSKLLRVLQTREIQRTGSPEVKKVDVRIIATTNRDLAADVIANRFRQDLFHRLSNIEVRVPCLAERAEDIPVLIRHFVRKYSRTYGKPLQGLTRRARIALLQYDWPGNVRELESVISSAAIGAEADFIDLRDLPQHLQKPRPVLNADAEGWRPLPLDDVRRIHIERVLEACKNNRVRAAHVLGIGRTSLYRFLKRTGRESRALKTTAEEVRMLTRSS